MGLHILLVEDDEDTRQLLQISLSRKNYKVDIVEDAYAAQKYLKEKIPDLILVDIMMPGMNGIELCSWIRSQPQIKNIPIIQMSALGDEATIEDSFRVGVMDFVNKPIDFELLIQKIELAYKRSQRRIEEDGKPSGSPDSLKG